MPHRFTKPPLVRCSGVASAWPPCRFSPRPRPCRISRSPASQPRRGCARGAGFRRNPHALCCSSLFRRKSGCGGPGGWLRSMNVRRIVSESRCLMSHCCCLFQALSIAFVFISTAGFWMRQPVWPAIPAAVRRAAATIRAMRCCPPSARRCCPCSPRRSWHRRSFWLISRGPSRCVLFGAITFSARRDAFRQATFLSAKSGTGRRCMMKREMTAHKGA